MENCCDYVRMVWLRPLGSPEAEPLESQDESQDVLARPQEAPNLNF
jgi:hypothetical protein